MTSFNDKNMRSRAKFIWWTFASRTWNKSKLKNKYKVVIYKDFKYHDGYLINEPTRRKLHFPSVKGVYSKKQMNYQFYEEYKLLLPCSPLDTSFFLLATQVLMLLQPNFFNKSLNQMLWNQNNVLGSSSSNEIGDIDGLSVY